MGLFDDIDRLTETEKIVRAPFGYPGSKRKSIRHLLPLLPYREKYIEVFGGSGVVMLNRKRSKLDVYNDRFGGVVCFYRCIKDAKKLEKLCELLQCTIYAREEYQHCRDTWQNTEDEIERAAKWYYSVVYSFGSKGRTWGRITGSNGGLAGRIQSVLPAFQTIHDRLQHVQIENRSWELLLKEYDSDDAVFYLDPPYCDTDRAGYHHGMKADDHRDMLNTIMSMKGFVAISGFANSLYDGFDWDNRHTWDTICTMSGNSNTEGNNKEHLKGLEKYGEVEEVLWVKE